MKEFWSCWVKVFLVCATILTIPFVYIAVSKWWIHHSHGSEQLIVQSILATVDQGELVAASRQLIKDKEIKVTPENISIPSVICQLKPRQIYVHSDMLKIRLRTPGGRSFLIYFMDDIKVHGQGMITNGLWYVNLNMKTTNKIIRTHSRTGEISAKDNSTVIVDFNNDGTVQSQIKYNL